MFRPNVYFKENRESCQDLFTITRRSFQGFLESAACGREKAGAAPERGRAAPAAADASAQALAAGGKVMPPTLTFTAAISRPVMDSTAFFTPSWTARPTSGMVWP